MTASNTAIAAPSGARFGGAFWERLWRLSGVNFVIFFVAAAAIYGFQPAVGASPETLQAFYGGERARILIAAVVSGMAMLNLLWFVAALRAALADAGQAGWGAAAAMAGSAFAAVVFLLTAVGAALAYSVAGVGNGAITSALNDFAWACGVLSAFPHAMLIMAGSFGFWRAKLISNGLFAGGVAALLLVLLGGTTWLGSGVWAPDGIYARFVSPAIGIVWVLVATRIILTRSRPATVGW